MFSAQVASGGIIWIRLCFGGSFEILDDCHFRRLFTGGLCVDLKELFGRQGGLGRRLRCAAIVGSWCGGLSFQ
jgi:hypothetical protein